MERGGVRNSWVLLPDSAVLELVAICVCAGLPELENGAALDSDHEFRNLKFLGVNDDVLNSPLQYQANVGFGEISFGEISTLPLPPPADTAPINIIP